MKSIVMALAAALAGAASAQGAPDLRQPVVVGDKSAPVRLELGQLLEVRLPMQAGTGYSWAAMGDSVTLEFIDQATLHPWGGAPSAGGSQVQMFIYRAIGPGEAVLRFAYRRPWESGAPPARTVEQRVTIEP